MGEKLQHCILFFISSKCVIFTYLRSDLIPHFFVLYFIERMLRVGRANQYAFNRWRENRRSLNRVCNVRTSRSRQKRVKTLYYGGQKRSIKIVSTGDNWIKSRGKIRAWTILWKVIFPGPRIIVPEFPLSTIYYKNVHAYISTILSALFFRLSLCRTTSKIYALFIYHRQFGRIVLNRSELFTRYIICIYLSGELCPPRTVVM